MGSRNKRKHFDILKSSGEYEHFSPKKLHQSLRLTGLPKGRSEKIVSIVSDKIEPGDSTKDIYRHAYQLVKQESPLAAVHYSLKKALQALGPTGYVFEMYVAKYFEAKGFQTVVDQTMPGRYVTHEVDVIASKSKQKFFVECKFHNNSGHKNDVKISLYVKARWDDLKEGPEGKNLAGFYLATNTAFTGDAIRYAEGTGLHLLGVNAPREKSFIQEIRELKLFPITSLIRIKKHLREKLFDHNILLCSELLDERALLNKFGLDDTQVDHLFFDVQQLLADEVVL